jgi:hypothetical protein
MKEISWQDFIFEELLKNIIFQLNSVNDDEKIISNE